MSSDTPDLFAAADPSWPVWPRSRPERRFAAFHAANPHVYAGVERRAMELYRAGARSIGVKAIGANNYHPPHQRRRTCSR